MKEFLAEVLTCDHMPLIRSCIKGERKSQKMLYDLYSGKMFHTCLSFVDTEIDAEVLLQHGFVVLFQNLDKFKFDRPFQDWAKSIFINTAIEFRLRDEA